jgi:hypothetical protein
MDDLTDLLRLAEHEPPPADLADRLWPDVHSTYRLTRDRAHPDTSLHARDNSIDDDDWPPITISLDDLAPVERSRRGRLLVAVAAVLLVLGAVGIAWIGARDTETLEPAIDQPDSGADQQTFAELCADIEDDLRSRTGTDLTGLDILAADLRELARRVENGAIPDVEAVLSVELERAANTFDQARRTLEAGDVAVARQAASQAAFWNTPALGIELGGLRSCFP